LSLSIPALVKITPVFSGSRSERACLYDYPNRKTKKKDTYRLTGEHDEILELHTNVLLQYALAVGSVIPASQSEKILQDNIYFLQLDYLLRILSRRRYSEGEIRRKLQSRQVAEALQQRLLARLQELLLVDDAKMAADYCQDLYHQQRYSHREIEAKLRAKFLPFIPPDDLEIDYEIRVIAARLPQRLKNESASLEWQRKTYAYFLRRGFQADNIAQVLRHFTD
jgi:SOS response regulatory protein OraA/RecX